MIEKMRKLAFFGGTFIVLFLSTYWAKCQLRIDVWDGGSLSSYPPFKYLAPEYLVEGPERGVLMSENFDHRWWKKDHWLKLWAKEKELVHATLVTDLDLPESFFEAKEGAVFEVESKSSKQWMFNGFDVYAVDPGERFALSCDCAIESGTKNSQAFLRLLAYENSEESDHPWRRLGKRDGVAKLTVNAYQTNDSPDVGVDTLRVDYVVPEGVSYLRVQLSGKGKGEFYFDNVKLEKLQDAPDLTLANR